MIKLVEAIKLAQNSGKNITRMDIARSIWADSKESTQQMNIWKLMSGKTKTYPLEWIKIICEITGVDANFLFSIEKMQEK